MKTRIFISSIALVAWLIVAQVTTAQAPAGAPTGATGLCNDGTYYTGANKKGACRGHKGVKEWYGAPATSAGSSGTSTSSTPSASSAAAPSTSASTPPSTSASHPPKQSSSATTATAESATPAPGGGPDKVWLNTATNVYHCPGTRYYGTTKAGAYMTEAEAKAKGAHADHGKPCKQ